MMQAAEQSKKAGNDLFKSGELEEAMKKYAEGISAVSGASSTASVSDTEACDLLSTCHSNRAACQLKLAKKVDGESARQRAWLEGCIEDCDRALALKPGMVKALFRRSQAYEMMENEMAAIKDLNKLLHIEPGNAEAIKAMQTLRVQVDKNHIGVSEVAKYMRILSHGKDTSGQILQPEDVLRYLKLLVGLCADDNTHTRDFTRQGGITLAEFLIAKSLSSTEYSSTSNTNKSIPVNIVLNVMILLGAVTQHDDFVKNHVATDDLDYDEEDEAEARLITHSNGQLSFIRVAGLISKRRVGSATSKRVLSVLVNILKRLPLKRNAEVEITGSLPEPPRVEELPEDGDLPDGPATTTTTIKTQEVPFLKQEAGKVFLQAVKSALEKDDLEEEDSGDESGLFLHGLDCLSTFLSSFSDYLTPDKEVDYRMETLADRKVRAARQRILRSREYSHATWALEIGMLESLVPAITSKISSVKVRAIPCFGRLITSACDEKNPEYSAPNLKEGESAPEGDLLVKSYLRDSIDWFTGIGEMNDFVSSQRVPQMLTYACITSALLACHPGIGVWAMNFGSGMKIIMFLIASGERHAQEVASEVVCLASATTDGAELLRPLLESGAITQSLLKSPHPATRAAAAAALTKLSIKAKALDQNSPEVSQVLNAAFDVIRLEVKNAAAETETVTSTTTTSSSSISSKSLSLSPISAVTSEIGSRAISSMERAVEVVAAMIGKSYVKEEIVHGSSRIAKAVDVLAKINVDPRSTVAYGLAYIFAALTVTNRELRAAALAEKEMTLEQYDKLQELQRIKTKDKDGNDIEEKKEEEDADTLELCMLRIKRVSASGAIGCLNRLMGSGSTKTKETCARALRQICVETSSRGIFIQEGGLKSCCDLIATASSPSASTSSSSSPHSSSKDHQAETAAAEGGSLTSSEARREAAHAIAKSLVTTNPSLLSAHQRLGVIHPLLDLCRDVDSTNLQQFEALLSLTNILTAGQAEVGRFIKEKGHHAVHYLVFSDHLMVRRAACEVFCNISFEEEVLALMRKPEKVRLWLGLCEEWDGKDSDQESYLIAKACSGALAGACGDQGVSEAVLSENVGVSLKKLLASEKPELIHRSLVIMSQLLQKDDDECGNVSMAKHFLESDVVLSLTSAVKCVQQIPELHAMAKDAANKLVNMCRAL